MTLAFFAAWLTVIGLAWTLASRRSEHKPIAVLLSVGLAADLLYPVLEATLLGSLRAEHHWATGMVVNALALVWPAAVAWAALVVFARKKPWAAVLGWACALTLLGFARQLGDGTEPRTLALVQVIASMSAAGMGLVWYGGARATRTPPTSAHFALMTIIVTEVVALFGAWRAGPFEQWPVSQGC
jgi:hypothetical protein